jgi:hypothetical protein
LIVRHRLSQMSSSSDQNIDQSPERVAALLSLDLLEANSPQSPERVADLVPSSPHAATSVGNPQSLDQVTALIPRLSDLAGSLPAQSRHNFVQYVQQSARAEFDELRNIQDANESSFAYILHGCLSKLKSQIQSVLNPMLDKDTILFVAREWKITTKDLGIKYKDTDMYKQYVAHFATDTDHAHAPQLPQPSNAVMEPTLPPTSQQQEEREQHHSQQPILTAQPARHLAPPSESQAVSATSSNCRKEGPSVIDIALLATPTANSNNPESETNPAKPKLAEFLEIKYILANELESTIMQHPDARTLTLGSAEQGELKQLGSSAASVIKRGIAQAIWYGAATSTMSNADDARRPIHGMFMVSGWFVRMIFCDRVVYVETVSPVAPAQTTSAQTTTTADFIQSFGAKFPHHLFTPSGAEAFYDFGVSACQSLIGPLASSPLTGCASSLALTPENILAAGLQSDTGQKALAHSKKRAREKAAKEEKKVKTPKTERGSDLNRESHTGQGTYTDTWVSTLSDQMTDGKMFEEPNDALSDTAGISPNAMGLEYGAEFDTSGL